MVFTLAVLVDVQKECRVKEQKYFDTHWSSTDADKLASYLYYLPYDEHVIIMTLGEAFSNMSDRAFDALSWVGVDIRHVVQRGQTFAALVYLGSQCKTMYELYEDDLAHLNLELVGNYTPIIIHRRQPCFDHRI